MFNSKVLLVVFMSVMTMAVHAKIELLQFDNPAQEQRYKSLIAELRCLVCQNQNLADSDAELAQDLRSKTFEMIKSGASDEEILEFMVARYGDFVLYKPPLKHSTWALWFGPFLLLAGGMAVLFFIVRGQRRRAPVGVTEQEHEKARRLLKEGE